MVLRGLDPKMIINLYDVVERKFSEMFAWVVASLADQAKEMVSRFETSSVDQDKDRMRKKFLIYLWS